MPTSATVPAVNHRRRDSNSPRELTSSPLVLLVEHELASRVSSANELLDEGYDIVESESASEAMSILRGRCDFDAMIGDIDAERAPGGLALVRYAANHHPAMKILVRSAWPDAQAESGEFATDFLPKPYPAGDLVRRMHGLLGYRLTPVREESVYTGRFSEGVEPPHQSLKRRKRSTMVTDVKPIYSSSNGDRWLLVHDIESDRSLVRHEPNRSSGGKTVEIDIDDFILRDGESPQGIALRALLSK